MQVDVKIEGLNGLLETLKKLPPEVVSKRGGPVKKALRKGALVILKQAKQNLQVATQSSDPEKAYSTGLLLKNLIASRGKPPVGQKGERYLIRVRRKAYPRAGKRTVTTTKTGSFLEYGSVKQPAEPWLRPAASAKAQEAMDTIHRELVKEIDKVQKKLAQQHKGLK
jgi:HK97 gp10 family phage protein